MGKVKDYRSGLKEWLSKDMPQMDKPPMIVTKCATCPISSGCGGAPHAPGRCLRGDDLAEIYALRLALANMLDLCTKLGDFKNGVVHQGTDEGEVYASGVFDQAYAALSRA